jgi:phosphate transport system permease protein
MQSWVQDLFSPWPVLSVCPLESARASTWPSSDATASETPFASRRTFSTASLLSSSAIVVLHQKHFSALAGGVALSIMMIPTITRTTEDMLLLVPQSLREAAYGLGIPRWRTTLSIVLRTATSGVITGIMLAFARVAGETAPLLFTAFGNQFWNLNANQPTAALPLQIFNYAISPYDEWHRQAWAGALVLIILIVSAVAAVRFAVRRGTFGAA